MKFVILGRIFFDILQFFYKLIYKIYKICKICKICNLIPTKFPWKLISQTQICKICNFGKYVLYLTNFTNLFVIFAISFLPNFTGSQFLRKVCNFHAINSYKICLKASPQCDVDAQTSPWHIIHTFPSYGGGLGHRGSRHPMWASQTRPQQALPVTEARLGGWGRRARRLQAWQQRRRRSAGAGGAAREECRPTRPNTRPERGRLQTAG